ncbi:MAG: DinB family protein [Bacteroidota bacterium]
MNKQAIIQTLNENYQAFINYVSSLSEEDYSYRHEGKWDAARQLNHINLSVAPLVQVYSLPPAVIEKNFGRKKRTDRSYEDLLTAYQGLLATGGKAPSRFVPGEEEMPPRQEMIDQLSALVPKLCSLIDNTSDEDLDSLLIPHPLLKLLTLREMLYNAIYHVSHHQKQIETYLAQKA